MKFFREEFPRRAYLMAELGVLFGAIPILYAAGLIPVPAIPFLLLMFLLCLAIGAYAGLMKASTGRSEIAYGKEAARIAAIFAASALFIFLLAFLEGKVTGNDILFGFAKRHPGLWLLVLFLYPLLSAYPQEFIYRKFFFQRYRPIFSDGIAMILASAALFSLMHIIFWNWIAVVLTFLGGLLFGWTYHRTDSLAMASIEHALYGDFIFTVGLGLHFYGASYHWQ